MVLCLLILALLSSTTGQCLQSASKGEPRNISELHPAHVSVVMALGDSMMAGFAAGHGPNMFHKGLLQENRFVSFAGGAGASDHRTLAYYLHHFNSSLVGASTGVHMLEVPSGYKIAGGIFDGYRHPDEDQLNAALSMAQSWDLHQELQQLKQASEKVDAFRDRWKVLTLMIGANDLSHPNACSDEKRSEDLASMFSTYVEEALRDIVSSFDRIYINVVGLPRLADLATLVNKGMRCEMESILRYEEINCVVEQSPQKLALLAYSEKLVDDNLRHLAAKYNHYTPNVAVVYHSLFRNNPLPDLSWVAWDCTHPSSLAHNAGGTLLWNSMLASQAERDAMTLEKDPKPACPAADAAFRSDADGSEMLAKAIIV
eukprot:TRINITY_DN110288_c0_g1_i1.p1 TRINITY_DN110288_c0_g1~~TRINITY_DN110288_c0_g1_i1.p1  ORF type:complete len:372 (+),score=57.95 TRINITY_DN110288_c0_g1_i1:51-1166(+)